MNYDPLKHHRHSIRLKRYDYSQEGLYFITICCQNRANLFGEIIDGEMHLNNAGTMVKKEWLKLTERFKNIILHEYVIMPNHFHAILQIVGAPLVGAQNANDERATTRVAPTEKIAPPNKTVGDILDAFKSITTVEYIRGVKNYNWQTFNKHLWQRNYWEHIIRDENSHANISEYILNNPIRWESDSLK